jgi:hypothetical protein
MLFEFLLLKIVIQIIGPFMIEFGGIFIVSSIIESSGLRSNPVMDDSQVGRFLHL